MKRLQRKRDRWGQRDKESLKKKGASEQQCQKRGTVVFHACCQLARHQLARGRCNWELWVIIATNLPQNTCAFPLIFTKMQRGHSCFQRLAPVSTKAAAKRRKRKSGGNESLHLQSCAVVLLFRSHTSPKRERGACGLSVIARDSEGPPLPFNRCLWIPPSERRLLQIPDKPR